MSTLAIVLVVALLALCVLGLLFLVLVLPWIISGGR